jgi:hypothetical protein
MYAYWVVAYLPTDLGLCVLVETSDEESERLALEAAEYDDDDDRSNSDDDAVNELKRKRPVSIMTDSCEYWTSPYPRYCSGYYGCNDNSCTRCLHKLVLRKKGHYE